MRYFIELSYKGTAYCGWQRQPNAITVQQTIEEALSKILRGEILITGCGRTDSGVHASFYIAHFESDAFVGGDIVYHLNCMLPSDIAIHKIYQTELHARFDAKTREYTYQVLIEKNPFSKELTWQYRADLDIEAMNQAAEYLLSHDDFETFSKVGSDNKTTICNVSYAKWTREGNSLTFVIRSDRFLRNMVRSIVGSLVDVGRKKITPEKFSEVLYSHNRALACSSAPRSGLFLSSVEY